MKSASKKPSISVMDEEKRKYCKIVQFAKYKAS